MAELTNQFLNILLVEDDADDSEFFKEALEKLKIPHKVEFAKDCYALFNMLEKEKIYDVIFLDINLPVIDGKECLKQIKQHVKYKDVPVIIFTGSSAPNDIDFVYTHGAHFHVVKPYARINYVASLKVVLDINWKERQPRPLLENFVVNLTFNN